MQETSRSGGDIGAEIAALVPGLRAYARSLTRGDPHAADDLVQDTVMLALQARDRFTPGTNLKAWLFRILRNRFHSVVGRRHVTAEVAVEDLAELGAVPALQEERIELPGFRRAFAALAPAHREVLVLFAVHGLAYEEIARICGCNVQAVKSRMNRARTGLKAMVLGLRPIPGPALRRPGPLARPAPLPVAAPPPAIPEWRRPWLAETERRLDLATAQLARYQALADRLARAGLALAGPLVVLRQAEDRAAHLRQHHARLLDGRRLFESSLPPEADLPPPPPGPRHAGQAAFPSGWKAR